jgi:hypothetical protein
MNGVRYSVFCEGTPICITMVGKEVHGNIPKLKICETESLPCIIRKAD